MNEHRMPSWSEDLTFAMITSDVNGLKTTMRNTTMINILIRELGVGFLMKYEPLYHKKPSPYRTLPSPASLRSKTHMQSPTSCRMRFAYFLLSSDIKAWSAGAPKLDGCTATVSWCAGFSPAQSSRRSLCTLRIDRTNISKGVKKVMRSPAISRSHWVCWPIVDVVRT